ncbi:MAG: DUF2332 domain-containing protein [Microthrixaceae bacterium]|nr:DUF2332 domain-containing protein [Microthrixaceae bacterium]
MNEAVSDLYRQFAQEEAVGVSQIYFEWAMGIAQDDEMTERIAVLPGMKRQPHLVFAASRWLGAPLGSYTQLREWLIPRWDEVVRVVLARSTQTNEAARCAVLLPVLSRLGARHGELALVEAGAAAGLVLYPDRYSYRYRVEPGDEITRLDPPGGRSDVVLPCRIDAESVPSRVPTIAWRAGVDLHPIDLREAEQLDWLETLVWPEHDARRARLHAAAELVAADPPHLVAGDIVERVPEVVAQAPAGAHIVVFHSAVLAYLPPERRAAFVAMMRAMQESMPNLTWISFEGVQVLPEIAAKVRVDTHGRMILAVDGEPLALVGPHGQSFQRL